MWDLPRPGIDPMLPALAGRFLTTGPPWESAFSLLFLSLLTLSVSTHLYTWLYQAMSIIDTCWNAWPSHCFLILSLSLFCCASAPSCIILPHTVYHCCSFPLTWFCIFPSFFSFFPPSLLSFLPLFLPPLPFLSFFKILSLSSLFLFLFSGSLSLGLSSVSLFHSLFHIQRIHSISRTIHIKPSLPSSTGEGNGTPLQHSCLENLMDEGAWWATVHEVAKSLTRLSDFTFTFHFHALEKEMATHSSVLAWRIPGTAEPCGLPSMGLHRVGHDWSNLAAAAPSPIPACVVPNKHHSSSKDGSYVHVWQTPKLVLLKAASVSLFFTYRV